MDYIKNLKKSGDVEKEDTITQESSKLDKIVVKTHFDGGEEIQVRSESLKESDKYTLKNVKKMEQK